MKKAVLGVIFVFAAIFFIGPAFATTSDIGLKPEIISATDSAIPFIAPPFNPTGIYELALFDKNGGVQIAGKIIFDSFDKETLANYQFTIPGENISLVRLLHEKSDFKKVCPPTPSGTDIYQPGNCYDSFISKFTTLTPITEKTAAGLKVTVNAKPFLSSQNQESLVFYYRTNSYTKKLPGSYRYRLPSIKVPYSSVNMQIGILVKDGLVLKGSLPGYSFYYSPIFNLLEKAKNLSDTESLDLTAMLNDIMYQGQLRKTESDLPPDTSFTVSGVYGSFWPMLFLKEILITIVILSLLVLLIVFLVRKFLGKSSQGKFIFLTVIISFITSLIVAIVSFLIYFLLKSQGVIMM